MATWASSSAASSHHPESTAVVTRPTIDGILLAAGESRRMGFPKPLLKIGRETFLARSLRGMMEVTRSVIVVTGAHQDRVRAKVPVTPLVRVVHNADFLRGQLSSLKCAIQETGPDTDAVIVHLADHPFVEGSTFRAVVDKYSLTNAPIVIARHASRRGHPVLFSSAVFPELLAAPDDQGARFVVNSDPRRVVYADVDDPGVSLDLDTPEDLKRAGLSLPTEGEKG
jgi:molybdenum cofactor cytidylyltransferase